VSGAAANYRNCNDAGQKAQCSAAARNQAPGAAKTAAFNGNCSQAKAIVAAATAMGASSVALNNAVKTCP
jgi:hypothetical protein